MWLGTPALAVLLAAGWIVVRQRDGAPPPRVVPLTTFPGNEHQPSFSPDGNQVAFSWDGEKQDNFDIYVKLIDSPSALRITTHPAIDISPGMVAGRTFHRIPANRGGSDADCVSACYWRTRADPRETVHATNAPDRISRPVPRQQNRLVAGRQMAGIS